MHVPEDHIRAFDRQQIGERIGDTDSPGIECPADVESPHSGIGHLLGLKVAEQEDFHPLGSNHRGRRRLACAGRGVTPPAVTLSSTLLGDGASSSGGQI
jgi:hypothetical protein